MYVGLYSDLFIQCYNARDVFVVDDVAEFFSSVHTAMGLPNSMCKKTLL